MFRLIGLLQIHIHFRMAPVYAKCVKWFVRQRSILAHGWRHAVALCILPTRLHSHRAHRTPPKISPISIRKCDGEANMCMSQAKTIYKRMHRASEKKSARPYIQMDSVARIKLFNAHHI